MRSSLDSNTGSKVARCSGGSGGGWKECQFYVPSRGISIFCPLPLKPGRVLFQSKATADSDRLKLYQDRGFMGYDFSSLP